MGLGSASWVKITKIICDKLFSSSCLDLILVIFNHLPTLSDINFNG